MWLGLVLGLGLGLGLDYGLGFSSDIRLRQDPQLRISHLATTDRQRQNGMCLCSTQFSKNTQRAYSGTF